MPRAEHTKLSNDQINLKIDKWLKVKRRLNYFVIPIVMSAFFTVIGSQSRPDFTFTKSEIHWGQTLAFAVLITSVCLFTSLFITSSVKLSTYRKLQSLG